MYSFILCAIILIASYFIYGKAIDKIAGVDGSRTTPAYRLRDNVDWRLCYDKFQHGVLSF